MRSGRAGAWILLAAGGLAFIVGIAGLLGAARESSPVVASPSSAASEPRSPSISSPGPSAKPSPNDGPPASPSPPASVDPSPSMGVDASIRAFVSRLEAAIRTAELLPMLPLLHPASIERYGEEACRTNLTTRSPDPDFAIRVTSIDGPAPWDYVTDGRTATIADAWTVVASVTARDPTTGQPATSERELHVAPIAGEVRWFTDCGTPLS